MVVSGGKSCIVGTVDATGKYETNDDSENLVAVGAFGQSFEVGTAGDLV